jgi:hypothetical protein
VGVPAFLSREQKAHRKVQDVGERKHQASVSHTIIFNIFFAVFTIICPKFCSDRLKGEQMANVSLRAELKLAQRDLHRGIRTRVEQELSAVRERNASHIVLEKIASDAGLFDAPLASRMRACDCKHDQWELVNVLWREVVRARVQWQP